MRSIKIPSGKSGWCAVPDEETRRFSINFRKGIVLRISRTARRAITPKGWAPKVSAWATYFAQENLLPDDEIANRFRFRPVTVNVIALCLMWPLWSCTSTTQSHHILQKNTSITMSSQELRVRVRSLARPLAGILQHSANEIMEHTDDPAVRKRALTAKTEAIPALFDALFRKDPGAALIDASALVEQFRLDYTSGRRLKLDAREIEIVLGAADDMKHRLIDVYLALGATRSEVDQLWEKIELWARKHPLQGSFAVRDSTESLLAASTTMAGGGLGGAISSAQEDLADFSVRADLYADILPRQARWQAQLLIEEMMANGIVGRAIEGVGPIPLSLETIPVDISAERQALIKDLRREGLLFGQWVQTERDDALGFVSNERRLTLEYLTEERITVLYEIRNERYALVEALDQQRSAAFEDLKGIVSLALVQSRKDLIDHLFVRSAQLLAVTLPLLFLGGLVLVWFSKRGNGP